MTYVCMYCRNEYASDDQMPADPRYAVSHGICGACKGLPQEELVLVTRRAYEVALISALVNRTERPHKPNMVRHLDWNVAQ